MTEVIVLEGMDGTGKSTTAIELCQQLCKLGKRTQVFREPGGTNAGEMIREVLLWEKMQPMSQFYLFHVARIELLTYIAEIKDNYDYVIFDRSYPSTYAYQVKGDGTPHHNYVEAMEDLQPYMDAIGSWRIFLLTLPEDQRLARMQASGKGSEQFEDRPKDYLERVHRAYSDMCLWGNVQLITADAPVERVADYICSALDLQQ
jgi:dTMP kinase